MNKYLIIAVPCIIFFCISNILSYNKGINVGTNKQKAIQADITAKQVSVSMSAIAKQTDAVTEAQSAIATATQERIVYKPQYIYVKGTESCANVCVDILKKGLE